MIHIHIYNIEVNRLGNEAVRNTARFEVTFWWYFALHKMIVFYAANDGVNAVGEHRLLF